MRANPARAMDRQRARQRSRHSSVAIEPAPARRPKGSSAYETAAAEKRPDMPRSGRRFRCCTERGVTERTASLVRQRSQRASVRAAGPGDYPAGECSVASAAWASSRVFSVASGWHSTETGASSRLSHKPRHPARCAPATSLAIESPIIARRAAGTPPRKRRCRRVDDPASRSGGPRRRRSSRLACVGDVSR